MYVLFAVSLRSLQIAALWGLSVMALNTVLSV
jgi:hypothetical protein